MTKDAFCILAMGYMGPEAIKWKLMFLAAFNSREASALQADARTPAVSRMLAELIALKEASPQRHPNPTVLHPILNYLATL